jgi:hypothetical protein
MASSCSVPIPRAPGDLRQPGTLEPWNLGKLWVPGKFRVLRGNFTNVTLYMPRYLGRYCAGVTAQVGICTYIPGYAIVLIRSTQYCGTHTHTHTHTQHAAHSTQQHTATKVPIIGLPQSQERNCSAPTPTGQAKTRQPEWVLPRVKWCARVPEPGCQGARARVPGRTMVPPPTFFSHSSAPLSLQGT